MRTHSQDMVNNHYFAHAGSDGSTPAERCLAEGYVGGTGENIAMQASTSPLDPYQTSLDLHDILFIDLDYPGRGHRVNMLEKNWTEVGIGYIHESNRTDMPYGGVVTCNFGDNKDGGHVLLGVVYEDADADLVYDDGEGVGRRPSLRSQKFVQKCSIAKTD